MLVLSLCCSCQDAERPYLKNIFYLELSIWYVSIYRLDAYIQLPWPSISRSIATLRKQNFGKLHKLHTVV